MKYRRLKLQLKDLNKKRDKLERELNNMKDVSEEIRHWRKLVSELPNIYVKDKDEHGEDIIVDMTNNTRAVGRAIISRYEVCDNFRKAGMRELDKINNDIKGIELELFLHPISVMKRAMYDMGISRRFS